MTFAVHVKNGISMSRIREKTQVGLEPKYQRNYRGIDAMMDSKGRYSGNTRFAKNIARMQGLCKGCKHFVKAKAKTVTGAHCGRKVCGK